MLEIIIYKELILLKYEPNGGIGWIDDKFLKKEEVIIKKTFIVTLNELEEIEDISDDDSKTFKIGEKKANFYLIYKNILNTTHNVLIHESLSLSINTFIVNNNISIFRKFETLAKQQIIIGGEKEYSIPTNVFSEILESFPTNTELKYYVESRVTNILSQYLEGVKDSVGAFEKYLEKRQKIASIKTIASVKKYEFEKYNFILAQLNQMLIDSHTYNEADWQEQILEINLILYPKYIACFSEVQVNDYYSEKGKTIKRRIDLMLVDSNGNIDVIEIKKPFTNSVVTKNKYRDNYTPLKELSGTVMQVEKYIFHLNKWGSEGEKKLNEKYSNEFTTNFKIQITNPKGLIIMGRNNNLTSEQLFDFEIIKRKYSNVMDIITYDDLLTRLENILIRFSEKE